MIQQRYFDAIKIKIFILHEGDKMLKKAPKDQKGSDIKFR
jgi:hypothetical protein